MKISALSKGKYYLVASIAILLTLSIGLSFCAWDSNSISNAINGAVSEYNKNYSLAQDANKNGIAEVGDTVYFGKYYQSANETDKTPLEWRVVDIRVEDNKNILYLLTERTVASGSINGYHWYFTKEEEAEPLPGAQEDLCYDNSTLRAWLNSDQGDGGGRVDGGIGFANPPEGSGKVFNGFYNEAFNDGEKESIVTRDIPGMYGYSYLANGNAELVRYKGLKNQKVWVPSETEVTGSSLSGSDSAQDRQFSYFAEHDAMARVAMPTDFNKLVNGEIIANYAMPNMPNFANNLGQLNKIYSSNDILGATLWWLRTPYPLDNILAIGVVGKNGGIVRGNSYNCTVSVRPAICLQQL